MRRVLVGLVIFVVALIAGTPTAMASNNPKTVTGTVKVKENNLTAFAAAGRQKAVALCKKKPKATKAKITVQRGQVRYGYDYTCAEVLLDPVGPTLPSR